MKLAILVLINILLVNTASADLFKFSSKWFGKNSKVVSEKENNKNNNNKKIAQKVSTKNSSVEKGDDIKSISAEAEKKNAEAVQKFMSSRNLGITDYTNTFDVISGTTLKGIILNSIVSSNLESPILVLITESNCGIPLGFKLICGGSTRGRRIVTGCSKLVSSSDEFPISAVLLNTDGTSGLTGEVFTGKEELVLGALVGGGLSAALDVGRDRISTATGELATNTHRNKVITGAMGGLDEAVNLMGEEAKSKETKISIEAGKEVLIFINQRFKI